MKFSASLDGPAKILTLGVSLLLLFVMVGSLRTTLITYQDEGSLSLGGIIGTVATFSILVVASVLAPKGYMLTSEALIIRRWGGNKSYPLSKITKAYTIPDEDMDKSLRMFGVGGFLGYFGRYDNNLLGSFTLYATQRKHYVAIALDDSKTVVITPDDLSLVAELEKRMNQ